MVLQHSSEFRQFQGMYSSLVMYNLITISWIILNKLINIGNIWECLRGVMVKAMACGIVVSEFVLQSRYYVHFQANTFGKGMNPISSQLCVK